MRTPDMIQAHIFYSGMVQGVGFRVTVYRQATLLGVKGWVRNTPDGRVEILVEAEEEKIQKLCVAVESFFDGYIQDKAIKTVPAKGNLGDFRII